MSKILQATIETDSLTGDVYDWTTGIITDGGTFEADTTSRLANSRYGQRMVFAGDQNRKYGYYTITGTLTTQYRHRFYIDPNGITIDEGKNIVIGKLTASGGPNDNNVVIVYLRNTSGNYEIVFYNYSDASDQNSAEIITDAPHWVEYYIIRAATNVSSDGAAQWWLDNNNAASWTSLDNYDQFNAHQHIVGGAAGFNANVTGTLYMDEFESNNTGNHIGATDTQRIIVS